MTFCHKYLYSENIAAFKQHKNFGQMITSDFRTISNTKAICKKAFKIMWIIRRQKKLSCPKEEIVTVESRLSQFVK